MFRYTGHSKIGKNLNLHNKRLDLMRGSVHRVSAGKPGRGGVLVKSTDKLHPRNRST